LALAGLTVWTLTSVVPAVRDSQVAIVMFSVVAFLSGMAALGAVVAGLASIKAAVFGPNPVLRVQWEQARLKGESCDSEA